MSLSVVAVTFGLIFVAELPDKTMIASMVLAEPVPAAAGVARAPPRPWWSTAPWPWPPAGCSCCSPTGWSTPWWPCCSPPAPSTCCSQEATEDTRGEEEADQRPLSNRRIVAGCVRRHRRGRAGRHHPDTHGQPGRPLPPTVVGLRGLGRRTGRGDGHRRGSAAAPSSACCPLAVMRKAAGVVLAGFAVYTSVQAAR